MTLMDTHAHLDDKRLKKDLPGVMARAKQKGVTKIVTVGTDLRTSEQAIEIAKSYDDVYATVGVHPHDAKNVPTHYINELERLVQTDREHIIALGEMGLDYYRNLSPKDSQQAVFRSQLGLAKELDLPVIIHDRAAHADTLNIVSDHLTDQLRGVFHCFGGDVTVAEEVLKLGFSISFTGNITFDKADKLRAVVQATPLDKIMLETDCPYMAPVPFRGKRNEPAYVRLVADMVAELKGIEFEDVVAQTGKNARELFLF